MNSVVYTALLGRYERLNEQPVAQRSSTKFVCFTDDRSLTSDTWEVRLVDPRFPWDIVRSSRALKILGSDIWQEYDRSLWIDNRVILKTEPERLLDSWLEKCQIAVPTHSYRVEVEDEYRQVLRGSLDVAERVREQYFVMEKYWPQVLAERPYWTGMLARSHSPQVAGAMRCWMDLVLRHSRRDQLSFNLALKMHAVAVQRMEVDNFESPYHQWLIMKKRRDVIFNKSWQYSVGQHAMDAVNRQISRMKHGWWERRMRAM